MVNHFKEKKILITGDTGFKGAWLSYWLYLLEAKVVGFSNQIPTQPSLFEVLNLQSKILHREGDVRDFAEIDSVLKKENPEIVFHLAAQSLVRESYENPRETFETNILGTVNILEAIRTTPSVKAVVIVTTDKCYENLGTGIEFKETDRLGGKDPYSSSKACAELVTHSYFESFYRNHPTKIASVRAGNVIGGGDWSKDRVIPDCFRSWKENAPVRIRNPQHVRPWQHVLEPLSGYLRVAQELLKNNSKVVGEAFNFGPYSENSVTVKEVVLEMQKYVTHSQVEFSENENTEKKEATLLRLNWGKAKERLNWSPQLSLNQSLKMTADWYERYYQKDPNLINFTKEQIQLFS